MQDRSTKKPTYEVDREHHRKKIENYSQREAVFKDLNLKRAQFLESGGKLGP